MKLDLTLRALFAVVENMPKPKTFLYDLLFTDRENIDVQEVQIEFKNGRRLIAPFVDRFINGQEMPKESFSGRTFKPYKIAPKRNFTADELLFERVAGENPFLSDDPETKRSKKIAATLEEQTEQIHRRLEYMASDVLYNLTLTVDGVGVKDVVKFHDNNPREHYTTLTLTWDQPTADPIGDLKGQLREISRVGGTRPSVIVMDPGASDLFMNNAKVKELMNLKNYFVGEVKPETEGVNGAIYLGTLSSLGLDIYEYQEFYDKIKDNGTTETVSLIPENTVLFAPKGNMVKFAAESSITDGILQGDLIPRIYEDEKNDSVELRTVSKPVLIPLNTKSLRILQVK